MLPRSSPSCSGIASALALGGLLMLVSPSLATAQLPTLGDGSSIASGAERRLGDRIARQLYRDPDYVDDPMLVDYVQRIWDPLVAAARARGDLTPELEERFAWRILLGRDRTINAFALPGGYLGLHSGLIGITATADEVASVMAHELSHVTQRHIARMGEQQGRNLPMMVGAMVLGALAASKNPQAASALMTGGMAVTAQTQLNFSRDMEREADRVGYGVMTQAGFDGRGFVSMFGKLQQASRINDNGSFPYLRSHPLTTERIADMQSRLQLGGDEAPPAGRAEASAGSASTAASADAAVPRSGLPMPSAPEQARKASPSPGTAASALSPTGPDTAAVSVLPAVTVSAGAARLPGPLEHALMAARARVLGNPGVDVLRDWASEPAGRSFGGLPMARRVSSLYAAAMAHSRQGDHPAAQDAAARLAVLVANDPGAARQARLLAAEVALEARRPGEALRALGPPSAAMARPELLLWVRAIDQQAGGAPDPAGRAMASNGDAATAPAGDRATGTRADAAQRLRTWVALYPLDATAWQALGTLYRALGQPLHAVRADAEAQVALLDYAAAVDRFRAGQELVRRGGLPGGVDHMEASIVDSRLREVDQMRKDWEADAKKEKF
jgi:predicted Zn-dependent protease